MPSRAAWSRLQKVARGLLRSVTESGRSVFLCSLILMLGCTAGPRGNQNKFSQSPIQSGLVARGSAHEIISEPDSVLTLRPGDLIEETPESVLIPRILTEEDLAQAPCRDLTLDEAVYLALTKSRVLRDLGGTVLSRPEHMDTKFNPSLVESDPRIGVEAALSEFDARWTTSGNFEKNDRAFNNIFFGGGTRLFQQDLDVFQSQISKTAATGTQYTVRNFTDYNANNAPGNQFGSAWNSNVEMEFRHPLLQHGGVEFNRIAGPRSAPGVIAGVLVARVNSRMSQAEFETALRDYLSNVANAYWDLYFAYRDYDIKRETLGKMQTVVSLICEKSSTGDREALAMEQMLRMEEEVQNALHGRQLEGTRNNNGAPGGSVRGTGGILVAERRLRLLIGLPIADGQLLRPADEPCDTEVCFDFQALINQSMTARPELKRQRLQVERRQLELRANRNFLMPQLDATGRYRWRGFGRDLAGNSGDYGQFNSAWSNLVTGNFQEWQLGVELDVPLGFRRAHAAVHHAELNLARERAILVEQERQVVHDLGSAIAEVDRAFKVCQTATKRNDQAHRLLDQIENNQPRKLALETQERKMDALRRVADAESRYFLARTELEVAIKNVFFEVGTLPQFLSVATRTPSLETDPSQPRLDNALRGSAILLPNPAGESDFRSHSPNTDPATLAPGAIPPDPPPESLPEAELLDSPSSADN